MTGKTDKYYKDGRNNLSDLIKAELKVLNIKICDEK